MIYGGIMNRQYAIYFGGNIDCGAHDDELIRVLHDTPPIDDSDELIIYSPKRAFDHSKFGPAIYDASSSLPHIVYSINMSTIDLLINRYGGSLISVFVLSGVFTAGSVLEIDIISKAIGSDNIVILDLTDGGKLVNSIYLLTMVNKRNIVTTTDAAYDLIRDIIKQQNPL